MERAGDEAHVPLQSTLGRGEAGHSLELHSSLPPVITALFQVHGVGSSAPNCWVPSLTVFLGRNMVTSEMQPFFLWPWFYLRYFYL